MNVLVTGAGGFIGSHLTETLVERGFTVRAFIRYNSASNWGWLEKSRVKNDVEIYMGDIRDYDSVKKALKGVETVFHLAALIGIPYSYESPLAYIKTNIEGTYNILYGSLEQNVSRVIHTSTSEVYGTALYVPIDENHPLQAQSPYAASKIGADQMALSFYKSFNLRVSIARPFNTFGPRQSARAIIPTIISQALSGKKNIELGNLTPTRDLNYVVNTVEGFLAIASSDKTVGEVVNIGSGREISIGDLAKMILGLTGMDAEIVRKDNRTRPENSEVERLCCDSSRLKSLTGWEPSITLEEGLRETVAWISENLDIYKPWIYNI